MCTVTWVQESEGYELFFNRDEKRERQLGGSPQKVEQNGIEYLAPIDGESGGTWIGVNQGGVTHCLLNYYHHEKLELPPQKASRGKLVTSLMDVVSEDDLSQRLTHDVAKAHWPFLFLSMFPGKPMQSVLWDGETLAGRSLGMEDLPVSTSSFDTERVIEERQETFQACLKMFGRMDGDVLRAYHSSHEPTLSAYSVCMHREESETVSMTSIRVTSADIVMQYLPDSPCKWNDGDVVEARLRRRQTEGSVPRNR